MYGKLFAQMYNGTLATRGPWEALVTFQQFLILCDREGFLDMTPEAISRLTTIPIEIIQRGIAALEEADAESRTPDEGGRRIVRLSDSRSWGWKIVNYLKYRSMHREEDRREYMRTYMREKRADKSTTVLAENANEGLQKQQLAQLAYSNASVLGSSSSSKQPRSLNTEIPGFALFWTTWPHTARRVARSTCEKLWRSMNLEPIALDIVAHVKAMAGSKQWKEGYEPAPKTYLNQRRWEDGPTDPTPTGPDRMKLVI